LNRKTAVDGHKKAQKAQNEKGGVATGVPDPVRVSARSRKFLNHEWTQRDIAATKVAQTSKSISISQNRCKPRRIFGARLCAQHQPQHGRDSNALRLGLRPQPRSILVAAWPRCAVSRISNPPAPQAFERGESLNNRRYSRLETCATLSPRGSCSRVCLIWEAN